MFYCIPECFCASKSENDALILKISNSFAELFGLEQIQKQCSNFGKEKYQNVFDSDAIMFVSFCIATQLFLVLPQICDVFLIYKTKYKNKAPDNVEGLCRTWPAEASAASVNQITNAAFYA